jgi:hypothetical protein
MSNPTKQNPTQAFIDFFYTASCDYHMAAANRSSNETAFIKEYYTHQALLKAGVAMGIDLKAINDKAYRDVIELNN